jgi:CBS domain-containing protein
MPKIADLLAGHEALLLPGEATALQAARAMAERRVGAVLVVDEERRPRGMFTERDLMVRVIVAGRDPTTTRIEDVMTRELFVAHPADSIASARAELQKRHIRHLPIVEDGRVTALLSIRDLLRADLEVCQIEVRALTHYVFGTDTQP